MSQLDPEIPSATATPSSGRMGGSNLLPPHLQGNHPLCPVDQDPASPFPRRKNRKYRAMKPPKDSKIYKAAIATIALRAQGLKYDEIAEQLGLTKNTILTYLKRANRLGYTNLMSFDDPEDRLEFVLKHKVTENINAVLNESTEEGVLTDRAVEVTMKVAAGTGLLKQHQVVKGETQPMLGLALKVQVEMPSVQGASTVPAIRANSIGGAPYYDAEIVEARTEE